MDTTNDEGKNNETVIDAQESKEEESDNESESEEEKSSVGEPVTGAQGGSEEEEIGMDYESEEEKSSVGEEIDMDYESKEERLVGTYTTRLQRAIESGDGNKVKEVLGAMSDNEVKIQLCATYGGAPKMPKSPDARDLYPQTSPVLHAARRGDISVFLEVLRVMREKLGPKVKAMVISKDTRGRSLLMAAVESGSTGTFEIVLNFGKENLSMEEMKAMVSSKDTRGRSLLMAAVERGDIAFFEIVLEFVMTYYPKEEMKAMVTSKDMRGHSLLVAAVESGNIQAVGAVLSFFMTYLQEEMKAMLTSKDTRGRSLLVAAVESGNIEAVRTVLVTAVDMLPEEEANTMIRATGGGKNSVLAMVVKAGSKEVFLAMKKALETVMAEIELYELIAPETFLDCDLLLTALRIDSATEEAESLGLLKQILESVGDCLYPEKEVSPQDGMTNVPGSASGPNVTPTDRTQENLRAHPVEDDQNRDDVDGHSLLCWGIRFFEIELFSVTPDVVKSNLVDKNAAETLQGIFSVWADNDHFQKRYKNNHDRVNIKSKVINDASKKLLRKFLERLAEQGKLLDWVRTCLAGPLVSSKNPFVNGMTLSVEFARAADVAPEGERRFLSSLHNCVNDFLLEVLERLPQTVMGFQGGMSGCENMLLSKVQGKQSPLDLMIQRREQRQIYCMAPLVMDFLTRRFSRGLPDFRDEGGILGDKEELRGLTNFILGSPEDYNADNSGSVLLGKGNLLQHMRDDVAFLQGGSAGLPGLAGIPYFGGFPGLQFIVAGLLDKPSSYYRVPAMRMAMHFVVYVAMLVLFYQWVLLRDNVTLAWQEIFFFVAFVLAGFLREGFEIARGLDAYFSDGWNILDLWSLTMLLVAFIVRCADGDNPWGHALYALSAPLICARVLFFLQILRFHGPMIQVIFSMMGSFIQFGVIMVVFILGFVMAFRALLLDVYSEGNTWRNLFKAMLGNLELFDELEDETKYSVAIALLVVYLLVINVVLLNLLVAVLTTSHSKVEENAEQEFRDANIRIFQFYETAVEENLFPAPFNLLQLLFTFSFKAVDCVLPNPGRACGIRADECFGQLVLFFVLSPVAFAVGVLLWLISSVRAPFAWYMHYSGHPVVIAQGEGDDNTEKLTRGLVLLRCIAIFLWCIFVAPAWLLFLLARQLFRCIFVDPAWFSFLLLRQLSRRTENVGPNRSVQPERDHTETVERYHTESVNVHYMLAKAPGGVGARDLFMYLQDPMNDPEVRTDEIDRRTTVRHVKLLRNRLEATTKEEIEQLKKACREIAAQTKEEVEQLTKACGKIAAQTKEVEKASREIAAQTKEEVKKARRKIAAQNDETKRKLEKIFDMMRQNQKG